MKLGKRTFTAGIAAALLTVVVPPGTAVGGTGDNQCWNVKTPERKFARKINKERLAVSLGRLRLDPELSKVARKHSRKMAAEGTIFHQTSDQLRARVTNWDLLGENVGVGATVASLHEAFMNSPGHAANVLRSTFVHHGVGVVKSGGRIYVTMVFQATKNPGTTLKMPSC